MEQATDILVDTINCVKRNHPTWTTEMNTKGGISGYNAGCGNVQTWVSGPALNSVTFERFHFRFYHVIGFFPYLESIILKTLKF